MKISKKTKQRTDYVVKLTEKEASFVVTVLGLVTGDSAKSYRGEADRLYSVMRHAGVNANSDIIRHADNYLKFKDFS